MKNIIYRAVICDVLSLLAKLLLTNSNFLIAVLLIMFFFSA